MENALLIKMKRLIGYLAYILILGYLTSLSISLPISLKLKASTNLDLINLSIFYFCFPILLGILFAVPRFIAAVKSKETGRLMLLSVLPLEYQHSSGV